MQRVGCSDMVEGIPWIGHVVHKFTNPVGTDTHYSLRGGCSPVLTLLPLASTWVVTSTVQTSRDTLQTSVEDKDEHFWLTKWCKNQILVTFWQTEETRCYNAGCSWCNDGFTTERVVDRPECMDGWTDEHIRGRNCSWDREREQRMWVNEWRLVPNIHINNTTKHFL